MRKKILFACLSLGIGLYLILTRQPHRKEETDVISAISMQNAASYEEHIAVLLNSSAEQSADKIKEEILDRYDKNTFHSILFNQNLSTTDKLYVEVYKDKQHYNSGIPVFSFEYPEAEKEERSQ